MKIITSCTFALLAGLGLAACNDKIDVKQDYDFALSCWHLPSEIVPGERVEIRFTLTRQGDFKGAEYYIGYIQLEGKGKVTDRTDMPLWSVVRYTNCKRSRGSMRTIHIGRCSRSTTRPCRTSGRKSASSWSTISAGSGSWRSRSTARGNSGRKFVIHSNLFNFVQSMG